MSNREITTKIVDEIIIFAATSAVLASVVVAPNIMVALDKPLKRLYKKLDARERERETRRIIYNMKLQGYLAGSYEHGLQLTEKARHRLERIELDRLTIEVQHHWDHSWRVILYDIPEHKKSARNAMHDKLRRIGCLQLQRSVWITPFPCREIVEAISGQYAVDTFVTYFEAQKLDNEQAMLRLFSKKYPRTKF